MELTKYGFGKVIRMVAAGLVAVIVGSAAQAGSVVGTQAFSVALTSLDTSSIATATTINFSTITTSSPETGDFMSIVLGTAAGSGTFTVPSTFTFGNANFGTFTATGLNFDISGGNFRNIELVGTFQGGTLFGPGMDGISSAKLDISLNQVGGPNTAIGATFTLVTTAIPEPASVVMLGLGLVGTLGLARVRRK